MIHLIKKANSLLNQVNKEVSKREKYFLSKPESWQESVSGDKYSTRTDMLSELSQEMEAQLNNFPPYNKYKRH